MKQITVYNFSELSPKVQAKTLDTNRYAQVEFNDWWDAVYEDFERICEILGVSIKMGRGTRRDPCIYFSGFYSQGDGACFEGDYIYAPGALTKILAYAPLDTDLHQIARSLQDVQRRHFYKIEAKITHNMEIDEEKVAQPLRDLSNWLYRTLEKEQDYLTSDEAVTEFLVESDLQFTEEGRQF